MNKNIFGFLAILPVLLLFTVGFLIAAPVDTPTENLPVADSLVRKNDPDFCYGGQSNLAVGNGGINSGLF